MSDPESVWPPRPPVWKMIDAFLELYPDEEYGFAHIVLSDQNLEDSSINYCLTLEGEDWPHRPETDAFLKFLKAIPEDIRFTGVED